MYCVSYLNATKVVRARGGEIWNADYIGRIKDMENAKFLPTCAVINKEYWYSKCVLKRGSRAI
jgi:hypothetical protein